eukprot:5860515-Pyramimonas_sp.AAC.1
MNESEWNKEFGSRPTAKETKNIPKMEVSREGGEGEETVFVFKWEPHLMHLRTHSISSKTEVRMTDKRLDPADHLYARQAEQVKDVARSDAGITALEALCAASLPSITAKKRKSECEPFFQSPNGEVPCAPALGLGDHSDRQSDVGVSP